MDSGKPLVACAHLTQPNPPPYLIPTLPPTRHNTTQHCRVAAIDSGKPLVDAAFGEVMVTCEKLWWLVSEGERYLRPERRSAGYMVGVPGRADSQAAGV